MESQDEIEVATEGLDRPGDMIVRKGHFILKDDENGLFVPKIHVMNWKAYNKDEYRVMFIVRDPRDIAVSGAYYRGSSVQRSLHSMITGTGALRFVGPWNDYVLSWILRADEFPFVLIRYEDLLKDPQELELALFKLGLEYSRRNITTAYIRQRFDNRVRDIKEHGDNYKLGKSLNLHLMHKGVAGEWRSHFEPKDAELSEKVFGELLRLLHYTKDSSWVKKWS